MKNKKIDWTNHLIELVVVFIGISLAFMLNNWREGYKDHELRDKYLASFYSDIQGDHLQLDTLIRQETERLDQVGRLLTLLQEKKYQNDSVLIILSQMASYNPFNQNVVTYESIKNSGNLSLISDYNLRQKLIGYYQQLEDKKLIEGVYFDYFNKYIIPFVMTSLDLQQQKFVDPGVIRSVKFRNIVGGSYQLLRQNLDFYQTVYQKSEELLTELKDR